MDETTTVKDLKEAVREFCEERDWDQFHDGKELAIGMLTEAGELIEVASFSLERCGLPVQVRGGG